LHSSSVKTAILRSFAGAMRDLRRSTDNGHPLGFSQIHLEEARAIYDLVPENVRPYLWAILTMEKGV
jgi:hypothetical protein